MAQHAAPGPASVVKMRSVRHLNRHVNQRDSRKRPIPLVHIDDPDTFVTVQYTGRHRRPGR
jgi:hypothetical protein